MNTCVLCLRRLNAFEWTMRSRSRWNGVRWSESGSGSSRSAGYEREASGESCSSCRSTRARKLDRAKACAMPWRAYLVLPRRLLRERPEPRCRVVEVVQQKPARVPRAAAALERVVGHVVVQGHPLSARPRGHLLQAVHRVPALMLRCRLPLAAGGRLEPRVRSKRPAGALRRVPPPPPPPPPPGGRAEERRAPPRPGLEGGQPGGG